MISRRRLWLCGCALLTATQASQGYVVTALSPSLYDNTPQTMNENLGLDDAFIEDFEDTTLIAPLSIEWHGSDFGPSNVLPRLFNPTTDFLPQLGGPFPGNLWDGSHALTNGRDPADNVNFFGPDFADRITFHFDGNPHMVGFGLSNFQDFISVFYQNELLEINLDLPVWINDPTGTSTPVIANLGDFADFVNGAPVRNLYLKIAVEEGEVIESVTFGNPSLTDTGGGILGLVFDHVAYDQAPPVPEPASITILLISGLILTRRF